MIRGLKVGIIGAGRSGLSAAMLAKRLGAEVLLSDAGRISGSVPKGIQVEEGGHTSALLKMDLLVRSPGVPNHLPILEKASGKNIPLWGELEFAFRATQAKTVVAITGTNGKTTTTALVGAILKADRRRPLVGGNIGTPLSELAERSNPRSTVVLEVSSYQLENIETFHPIVAAVLNVTPDHLEHHGSMKAYAAAKARLFENQNERDTAVLNFDDPWCRRMGKKCKSSVFWFSRRKKLDHGIYWKKGRIHVNYPGWKTSWPLKTRLPGLHNVENILASVAMSLSAGVPLAVVRKVLEEFPGVEHRIELVRELQGVRYVNDSKATNVDSTRVALESFENPLILIMGGRGKGSSYRPLSKLVRLNVKKILLIGEDSVKIRQDLGSFADCEECGNMKNAVQRARDLALPGDTVLLSPACASFDQYKNYEERGRHFKTLAQKLR